MVIGIGPIFRRLSMSVCLSVCFSVCPPVSICVCLSPTKPADNGATIVCVSVCVHVLTYTLYSERLVLI